MRVTIIFTIIWSIFCLWLNYKFPNQVNLNDLLIYGVSVCSTLISIDKGIKRYFKSKEKVVIGFKIKIIKSGLNSYWYADHIDKEYWAYLDEDQKKYVIIPEGVIYKENSEYKRSFKDFGNKCVFEEDCEVLKSSHIIVDIVATSKIIDVAVKDLHVDRKK